MIEYLRSQSGYVVSEVQTRFPGIRWNHIRSRENPSDCASRGMSARDLVDHKIWWSGPPWFREPSIAWPIHDSDIQPWKEILKTALAEERKAIVHHADSSPNTEWELPFSYSSWFKLIRVTAYLKRFIKNLRIKITSSTIDRSYLTAQELRDASVFWCRLIQLSHFPTEWKALELPSRNQVRCVRLVHLSERMT